MIPTPVVRRFLKDVDDGHYDRYVDPGINSKLQNPAQRRFRTGDDGQACS